MGFPLLWGSLSRGGPVPWGSHPMGVTFPLGVPLPWGSLSPWGCCLTALGLQTPQLGTNDQMIQPPLSLAHAILQPPQKCSLSVLPAPHTIGWKTNVSSLAGEHPPAHRGWC